MDLAELIELGKRLRLIGDELEQWVLEEPSYWRKEEALEREAKARGEQALKDLAEIKKEIAFYLDCLLTFTLGFIPTVVAAFLVKAKIAETSVCRDFAACLRPSSHYEYYSEK